MAFLDLFKSDVTKMKEKRDIDGLLGVLRRHGTQGKGMAAVHALAEIRDARALKSLIAVLGDESRYMREGAAIALGEIGNPELAKYLAPALNDEEWSVGRATAMALERLNWQPSEIGQKVRYLIFTGNSEEVAELGNSAAEPLFELMKKMRLPVAAYLLGKVGGNKYVEPLIDEFKNNELMLRRPAARALGSIRNEKGLEILILALRDSDSDIRLSAVIGLIEAGDTRALDDLIAIAENKDEEYNMREYAVEALGEIGDPRAMGTLIDILKKSWGFGWIGTYSSGELEENWHLKAVSLEAIGKIAERGAIQELESIKDLLINISRSHSSSKVREAANDVLKEIQANS